MNDVPEGANPPNSATPNFDRYVEYDYSLGMPVKARYVYCDRIDDDPNNPCSVETEQILAPLVVDRDYHPGGLPHHTYFNNGVDEITELDPWGMTRPYRMVVSAGSTDFWDSGYFRYDGAGNITNIGEQTAYIPGLDATSTSISWSESYSYDRLSRLMESSTGLAAYMKEPPARTYLYDAFGNMLENGPHDLTHDGDTDSFSTMNRLPYSLGAVYDPAGNLTAFGQHGYSYDPFNRMVHYEHEVPNEARTGWDVDADYDYWYDVDGERLGKCRRINDLDPETTYEEFTLYLRDESGNVMTEFTYPACPASTTPLSAYPNFWNWRKDHAYFGGKQVATVKYDPNYSSFSDECEPNNSAYDIFLHHKDHLGTLRVVTKWMNEPPLSGNEFELYKSFHAYWPYGEEITNQTQDDLTHRYTGHERDFESNLDYMHARYYSQFQGRFMSPDRSFGNPLRPTSFNKYAYALGNPIRFIDIGGLAALEANVRNFLETWFETDLSKVRVHTGIFARFLSWVAGAEAITLGQHIFMSKAGGGKYKSKSAEGMELIGHETKHTLQYSEEGFINFLSSYLTEYRKLRKQGLDKDAAYFSISYEQAAYKVGKEILAFLINNNDILHAIQEGTGLTEEQKERIVKAVQRSNLTQIELSILFPESEEVDQAEELYIKMHHIYTESESTIYIQ